MRYRWILFDADGTLFDFERSSAVALRSAVEQHGGEFDEQRHLTDYRAINARYWHALERGEIDQQVLRVARFRDFLTGAAMPHVDAAAFSAAYEGHLAEGRHLIDGAAALLARLHGRASMRIVTNGLRAVQRPRLGGSSVAHHFCDLLISEELGVSKPDPRVFEIAFERMGAPPRDQVLMVGDSLAADIRGGAAFGIETCWFNPRGAGRDPAVAPTHEIRSLGELLAICLGEAAS
ncbi:MAG: YjjG family noncanonical pyrimidine nucleotidase [Planctomycetota bacterium]